MRDLKECQAEIFRRSEEIIKARKRRRKQLIATCIPLVMCLVLACALFLPEVPTEGMQEPGAPEGIMDGLTGTTNHSLTSAGVWVEGYGLSLAYTEKGEVQKIVEYLNSVSVRGIESENADEDSKENGMGNNSSTTIADSAHSGIAITVVTGEETREFYLTDNALKSITKNETYPLSPQMAEELKLLLGILKEGA